ncbi:phage portal protein [Singulisphaera sp. PoT]|uniref:phage portal protein n=1 Tax=Singulisphaera sp. PoT TaxID=3411797 RepID=UPI003BF48EDD
MPAPIATSRTFANRLADLGRKAAAMVFPAFGGGAYGTGGSPSWGGGSSWYSYYLPGATRDYAAEAGDLWRNSAVSACLGWLTDNFSEPALEVVATRRNGVKEPVPNHPFTKRMCEPNPDYDADALWAATVLSFACSGDGYWIKCRAQTGVKELYWAPYWEIEPRWAADGRSFIDYYDHVVDGKRYRLERGDVVHFRRGLNPTNVRTGLPMLEPVLREVVSDNAANTYVAAILKNMGIPGVVIMPESDDVTLEDPDRAMIQSTWVERSSADNVGKPIVSSVKMKVQELTLSPEKLTLDRIRKIPEARICAAFRLPAMVVGLSVGEEQKTYANLEQAERMAYRNCLIPLQKNFAKALTRQLLPDLGGVKDRECVRWNYSEVEAMNEERDVVANRSVTLYAGGIASQEEARSMNGLGPAKAGDMFVKSTRPGDRPIEDPDDEDEDQGDEPAKGKGKGKAKKGKDEADSKSLFGPLEGKAVVRLEDPDEADARKMLAVAAKKAGVTLGDGPLPEADGLKVVEALIDLARYKLEADALALMEAITPEPKGLLSDAFSTIKEWKDATSKFLRKTLLAGAIAMAEPLGAPEIAAVNVAHQAEDHRLENFAANIIDGTQKPDGSLVARAGNYGGSAWAASQSARQAKMIRTGKLWERSILEEGGAHCRQCLDEDAKGWRPIGTLIPIGQRTCKGGCRCRFEFALDDPSQPGATP